MSNPTPIVIADDLWEGDAEAVITSWLVSDGAEVAAGDLVAEIMSEKAQFEIEAPAAAQIERGDQRIAPQLRLGITVPAHGVLAIAVMVEQYGIERLADLLHDTLANFVEQRCPGQRFVHFPGIAITRPGVAVPGGQPWRAVVTPMNEQLRLLPGRLLNQRMQPAVGEAGIDPTGQIVQLGIGECRQGVGEQHDNTPELT